jgi:hypothetical protein
MLQPEEHSLQSFDFFRGKGSIDVLSELRT